MPIAFDCPRCGTEYRAADDKAGVQIQCRRCDAVVTVPERGYHEEAHGVEERNAEPWWETESREQGEMRWHTPGSNSTMVLWAVAAAVAIAVTLGVALVLQIPDVAGGGNQQAAAEPMPKQEGGFDQGGNRLEVMPRGSMIVRQTFPRRFPMDFDLRVTKNGEKVLLSGSGAIQTGSDEIDELRSPLGRMKTQPRPNGRAAIARDTARLTAERANLKLLAAAMRGYHKAHGVLPAPYMRKKGLSWRVDLLPYLNGNDLYKQFKLDEPWDSPHNKALITKMPAVYRTAAATRPGTTTVHVFVGPGTPFGLPAPPKPVTYHCRLGYAVDKKRVDLNAKYIFELSIYPVGGPKTEKVVRTLELSGRELQSQPKIEWRFEVPVDANLYRPLRFGDIVDGTENTIMALVAGGETAAAWTKPGGLLVDVNDPLRALGTVPNSGPAAVDFDGGVIWIPWYRHRATFSPLIQHHDGKTIKPGRLGDHH